MVLQILFTDARADESDVLPDGTNDRRGWPGIPSPTSPGAASSGLLDRSKLTTDVRNGR